MPREERLYPHQSAKGVYFQVDKTSALNYARHRSGREEPQTVEGEDGSDLHKPVTIKVTLAQRWDEMERIEEHTRWSNPERTGVAEIGYHLPCYYKQSTRESSKNIEVYIPEAYAKGLIRKIELCQ